MSRITKCLMLLLVSWAIGCGGQIRHSPLAGGPEPDPVATPTPVITSSQVFSNVPQVWNFVDGLGHHMTVAPSPVACAFGYCGDITVWHYTKDSCAGYWANRTPEQCAVATTLDELYFVLRHDGDGAWRCIGFTDIDYLGVKHKVQINKQPNNAPPYTIIPASSSISDPNTAYDAVVQDLPYNADLTDFSPLTGGTTYSATWRTTTGVELLGSIPTLISEQNEGCVKEHWNFGPDGLDLVIPIVGLGNNGVCLTMDSRLAMKRL